MPNDYRSISASRFTKAMNKMNRPGGKIPELLQRHLEADGHVMTMTKLAEEVKYKSYRSVNLQYGLLADSIAEALGIDPPETRLFLIAEFVHPHRQSNAHCQVVLRPEFAKALSESDWLP